MIKVINPISEYDIHIQIYDKEECENIHHAFLKKDNFVVSNSVKGTSLEEVMEKIRIIIEDREYIKLKK